MSGDPGPAEPLCPWCLGNGRVRVPPRKVPSAFGLIAQEASGSLPCPLCAGRAR